MLIKGLAYHLTKRSSSLSVVSFVPAATTTIATTTTAAKPTFTYTNGPFNLEWAIDTNTVDFTFSTSLTASDNIWAAFAFSNDKTMVILN